MRAKMRFSFLLMMVLQLLLSRFASAQEAVKPVADSPQVLSVFQKDETDLALDRAIAYLISKQREDGAILDKGIDTTMTSLSIMAMASVGIQPSDVSPEGQAMQKALAFVLKEDRVDPKGYFGAKDGSRMYGHGIITLMLTEMLGMGTTIEQDLLMSESN
jgi:hypothetical protein